MELVINHIGMLVKDIDVSLREFENLGYEVSSKLFRDDIRGIDIIFINKNTYCVELVSPFVSDSSVGKLLTKLGETPYHFCYECKGLVKTIEELTSQGYILIDEPQPAVAFDNRFVAFMYKNGVGLVELVDI